MIPRTSPVSLLTRSTPTSGSTTFSLHSTRSRSAPCGCVTTHPSRVMNLRLNDTRCSRPDRIDTDAGCRSSKASATAWAARSAMYATYSSSFGNFGRSITAGHAWLWVAQTRMFPVGMPHSPAASSRTRATTGASTITTSSETIASAVSPYWKAAAWAYSGSSDPSAELR